MYLNTKNLFYGTLTSLAVVTSVLADSCSDGPFEDSSKMVFGAKGAKDSKPFCDTKWTDGLVVTSVEVWSNKDSISGIQLTYSDGSSSNITGNTQYGDNSKGDNMANKDNYHHDIITWSADDKVTKMEAASNKKGNCLAYLHIEAAGKKLEVGAKKTAAKQDINVGAGLLLGATGEVTTNPTAWTPLFMGTNDGTATVTDMKFDDNLDDVNKKQSGISAVTLSEVYLKNTNPVGFNMTGQLWTFTGSTQKTTTSSTSIKKQNTFGMEVGIKVEGGFGVPFLADAKVGLDTRARYEYQTATDKTVSSSNQQTFSWSSGSTQQSDLVQPGHAKHCKASTWQGDYKGGYTSTVAIQVNGQNFTYHERGVFSSLSYTTAFTECQDILLKDVPASAAQVDASSTAKGARRAVAFVA